MRKEKPGRLARNACHESDAALAHGEMAASNMDPLNPFDGGEVETCDVCCGASREFAPDTVHNTRDPYISPYPCSNE